MKYDYTAINAEILKIIGTSKEGRTFSEILETFSDDIAMPPSREGAKKLRVIDGQLQKLSHAGRIMFGADRRWRIATN